MPTIIQHDTIPFEKGYFSKILGRKLITAVSSTTHQLWEQQLPPGGYIVPHAHPFEETITFLSGTVEITVNSQTEQLTAPASLFIPAHTLHSITNPTDQPAHLLAYLANNNPTLTYPSGQPKPVDWTKSSI